MVPESALLHHFPRNIQLLADKQLANVLSTHNSANDSPILSRMSQSVTRVRLVRDTRAFSSDELTRGTRASIEACLGGAGGARGLPRLAEILLSSGVECPSGPGSAATGDRHIAATAVLCVPLSGPAYNSKQRRRPVLNPQRYRSTASERSQCTRRPELELARHSKLYAFASVISRKRRRAALPNLGYLRTNQEYIMCANFDFLGQKVKSPGQVKVMCTPDRLQP